MRWLPTLVSRATKTPLQFRVFQEAYDRSRYSEIHPRTRLGRKHDFDRRYNSQTRALEAGLANVGLGVLFGNHRYPLEELLALLEHADHLHWATGRWPARVCLPTAKSLQGIGVTIPFSVESGPSRHTAAEDEAGLDKPYARLSEVLYALARLALPHIATVSSERDPPALLSRLDQYTPCTSLNVHPGVGDNTRFHEGQRDDTVHFEQAPSYSRDPIETVKRLRERGFTPLLGPITNKLIHDMRTLPSTPNLVCVDVGGGRRTLAEREVANDFCEAHLAVDSRTMVSDACD